MDTKFILSELADIAEKMDSHGFIKEADVVTEVMTRVATYGYDHMDESDPGAADDLSDPLISQHYTDMINDLQDIGVDVPDGISFPDLQALHDSHERNMSPDPERAQQNPFGSHMAADPGF